MPLRCLLFTTDEALVQPIWQVLSDLGIDGEHCKNPVDAVERVTTQLFQIVITDWQDQPEAAFLLKTARDLKASARPLTLAIVNEEARPQALQAGANSVLLKPIRTEQVRDTLGTACELLRSKLQSAGPAAPRTAPETTAMAAAAPAGSTASPTFVTEAPEKLRAGEFLQSATSAPGAQFDTESEVHEAIEAPADEVDALTDLEPTAAAVQPIPEQKPETKEKEPMTGWAALQARLNKSAPEPAKETGDTSTLLSQEQTSSFGIVASPAIHEKNAKSSETQPEHEAEAKLFAYMAGQSDESAEPAATSPGAGSKYAKWVLIGGLAFTSVMVAVIPRTRQSFRFFYAKAMHAGVRWLNPPPAALPQTVTQHDSFGQEGDEYKLPSGGNVPDAAMDSSQIRVVPVIDPTAKPDKNADANSGQKAASSSDQPQPSAAGGTDQASSTSGTQNPSDAGQNPASAPGKDQPNSDQPNNGQPSKDQPARDPFAKDTSLPGSAATAASPTPALPAVTTSTTVAQPAQVQSPNSGQPAAVKPVMVQPVMVQPASAPSSYTAPPRMPVQHTVAVSNNAGIPSSLRSQIASSTPESSGAKPDEAAMSSIEPVNLPEAAVRELLSQPVDPEYPAAARASGLHGSVVLQVLIGRDGTVQDAKFLQGSFVFARSAIDAVKQWHFKPYSMNGRAVSVQSTITLNFKPTA